MLDLIIIEIICSAMGRFDYKPEDCFDFHNAILKKSFQ